MAEWLSAPAFGPGGPGFEPRWSRPLSFRDVLGQDRLSQPLGSIPRFVHCMPPKSPLDLSCHKTDVKIQIKNSNQTNFLIIYFNPADLSKGIPKLHRSDDMKICYLIK